MSFILLLLSICVIDTAVATAASSAVDIASGGAHLLTLMIMINVISIMAFMVFYALLLLFMVFYALLLLFLSGGRCFNLSMQFLLVLVPCFERVPPQLTVRLFLC